jgi:pimeloyl-ACP methyl ester carboxylesterase
MVTDNVMRIIDGPSKYKHCLAILFSTAWLMHCSFMPEELKEFYKLPLPQVEKGSYPYGENRISYVRTGNPEGEPVVFVHGSPGSWEDWKLVLVRPRLKNRFNLIALNRPGWDDGSPEAPVVPELTVQSEMLRKILDLGDTGRKAILVGHSLGGPIALQMAVDYPDKVAAVVLLAPSLDPDLDAVLWYNKLADTKLIRLFLPKILAKSNDEIVALPQALRSLARELSTIDKPVVLVQGKKDRLVNPGNAVYAKKKLVNAQYHEVILPNFGHLIPHMNPAEVVLAIEEAASMIDKSFRPVEAAALPKQVK